MRPLAVFLLLILTQIPASAGIVVNVVEIGNTFVGAGDSQQEFTLEIRAGRDATAVDVGSYSFTFTSSVTPASFSLDVPPSVPPNESWAGEYNFANLPILAGPTQVGQLFRGDVKALAAPPANDPLSHLVTWTPESAEGLLGTVRLVFDRQANDVPVDFTVAAVADSRRAGATGFVTHGGAGGGGGGVTYTQVTTAYNSGSGVILGLNAVPEPSSLLLLCSTCLVGIGYRRRIR
ncbi:MAG: PEP-CTERM sorting domain-containing protein [Pirellulaceae bacterium]